MKLNAVPRQKLSERIATVGAKFINVGATLDDKHARLTAVCSAWNMACGSAETQQFQLNRYFESYQRISPKSSAEDIALMRKDMESLIERKLKLFQDDNRQIVSACVVPAENGYRIEVAAAII